jgi:ribosomal protein S18 acetylase RimI-like enzyme
MDDERFPEKIEIVKGLLSATMGEATVDYLPPEDTHKDYLHLFRIGRRPTDHRLWLGQELLEDLAVDQVVAWLKGHRVLELFAATTAKQVYCKSTLEEPRLIDRDD